MKISTAAVVTVSFLIAIDQCVQACVDATLKGHLDANGVTTDVSKLLEGKKYFHVYIRKVFTDTLMCSATKYELMKDSELKAKYAELLESVYINEETWKKTEHPEEFLVTGEYNGDDPSSYVDKVYTFHAEDNVIAQYACSPDSDYWRIMISVASEQLNTEAAEKSMTAALAKVDKLKPYLPGTDEEKELIKLPQTDCPEL